MLIPFAIGLLVFQCFSTFLGFLLVFFLCSHVLKKLFALCSFILVFFSAWQIHDTSFDLTADSRIASCGPAAATSTTSTGSTPVVTTSTTNTSSGGWTLAVYNQFVVITEFLPLQEQGGSSWIPRQFVSGIVKHTCIAHILNIFPPFQSFMLIYNFKGDFKINGRLFPWEQ